jgi:SP family sugar:H+ symporter-like MFS transporter
MVPEMKGFSIEQLDYLYNNNVPTLKFKQYHFDSEIAITTDSDEASVNETDQKVPATNTKASEAESG